MYSISFVHLSISGDVFQTHVTRTWEFNSTFPLRSVVIPKLIFQPVFQIIKLLSDSGIITLTGWIIFSSARFIMAILSLWLDFCVYRMLRYIKKGYEEGLVLIASSYVTLTFQCHTFTNSFESLLFVSLIYIIFSSSFHILGTNRNNSSRKKSKLVVYKKTDEIDRLTKSAMKGTRLSCFSCILFGMISVAGIYNRPTFVIFSFLPTLWWLSMVIRHSGSLKTVLVYSLLIIFSAMFTSVMFTSIDSLYFNSISVIDRLSDISYCLPFSVSTIQCLKTFISNHFVFTPWNFVQYNTRGHNLAEHGLHPFYLHFCVNMPLLFGPLMFYLLWSLPVCLNNILISIRKKILWGQNFINSSNSSTDDTAIISRLPLVVFILGTILIFSIFPHQEPRFLIPLLPLMILLVSLSGKPFDKIFSTAFIIFNVLLTVVFGFLHQGGLIPCILKLQASYSTHQIQEDSDVSYNFIFSHTYMPPKFPLLIQSSKVRVWDMKGGDFSTVLSTVEYIKHSDEKQNVAKSRIFLIIPYTVYDDLKGVKLNITLVDKFYHHLSFEDPPRLASLKKSNVLFLLREVYDQMLLLLLEIQ